MAQTKRPAEALALNYLREARDWTQNRLATAKGHTSHRPISRYENGKDLLSRAELHDMAALMGFSRDAVDALLLTYLLVIPPDPDESGSLVELTPEELRRIDRTVLGDGWTRAAELRGRLIAHKKKRKAEEAQREAGELWQVLRSLSSRERRELVEGSPEFRSWALVERLCLESERAAADTAAKALDLANLALSAASKDDGDERWRQRLQGYAWAYIANARRVANDHPGAEKAFARAWSLWNAGEDGGLLPEWRMLSLEASLRRDERRFEEALELLDRALHAEDSDPFAQGVLLLKKVFVCEQRGDLEGTLGALAEAGPFVEKTGERRHLFALRYETTKALCALDRYAEAEAALPAVRDLAEALGNELDLVRVVWLSAYVAAGKGLRQEAVVGLEQVRQAFSARDLPYDAALAALDLAVLYLKEGNTGKVKALVREMAPIFRTLRIARESLAVLSLFQEAAQQETATVELALHAITEIRNAMRTATPPKKS
jgi:transcriptional regulator with XRE-family HTH domain